MEAKQTKVLFIGHNNQCFNKFNFAIFKVIIQIKRKKI